MRKLLIAILLATAFSSFGQKEYKLVHIKTDLNTPTARIDTLTLITDNFLRDSANAQALIHTKVLLPLAMQKHDAVLFDSVLAKDFIYHGEEAFFNRQEYIHDRVNGKWTITDVKYENVVLEFYNDLAVLSYRNVVKEIDAFGKPQTYVWFWADIWTNENGRWKLKVLRAIN
jgi:hypothetical protein